MRDKTFHFGKKEEIVTMLYSPSKRIIIEVGVGNNVNGNFEELPNQNYEQYTLDIETGLANFESNAEIMAMVETFKNYCWETVVNPIRVEIEARRNADIG
ncbi:hypothetical protein C8R30_101170 [Nitrosomonas nitrosa]|uniref:hypothetical protein n=1 Tax=Nitrosomonas nitrosa TaxID=52442 RepID=UPI000D2FA625|nr:hypothetical protein [Nitrosomonas nitrosa]PTR04973.1 hypothetical protein C8R30_101170 [Nitrosomonas nitrosa]